MEAKREDIFIGIKPAGNVVQFFNTRHYYKWSFQITWNSESAPDFPFHSDAWISLGGSSAADNVKAVRPVLIHNYVIISMKAVASAKR